MGGMGFNPTHHLIERLPNHPMSTRINTKERAQVEGGWLVLIWECVRDHESHHWHNTDNDAPSGKHLLQRIPG